MGIKICPQCGGKVSDTRADCPHCQYDFVAFKKCPDCEEQIDASLAECPICGHVFEEETSFKDTQATKEPSASQSEQPAQNADDRACPYCNSAEPMQIGNDLYMCAVCKNKFMDKRGLPIPQLPTPKVAESEEVAASSVAESTPVKTGEATEELTDNGKMGKAQITNIVLLAIAGICWAAGLFFMLLVAGNDRLYYPLIEWAFGQGDTMSILAVIFIFVFGLCLFAELMLNLTGAAKSTSMTVSLTTLLSGAAAVSLTSCLECGEICFFCHANGWIIITLISLLGVSALCKIVSFVVACFYKPAKSSDPKKFTIILSAIAVSAIVVAIIASFSVKSIALNKAFKIEDGVLVDFDEDVCRYGITRIVIPDNVTSIGEGAFYRCDNLVSITIPDSVTSIGVRAFHDCDGLTSITIPDSVTSIGVRAFDDCDGLISLTIPDSVTNIGTEAFHACDGLASITIPDSVTNIGSYVFYRCWNLTSIKYRGTEEQWHAIYCSYYGDNIYNKITYNYTGE